LDFGFSEARKAVDFFLVELQVEEEVLAIAVATAHVAALRLR